MGFLTKIFGDYSKKEVKRVRPLCDKVLALEDEYSKLTDEQLQAKTPEFKSRLANGETLDDILPEAFAACREASWRVLGLKHFPVQIIGGIILHQGRIAEMKTGEGKTLVATLPAYLNALSGDGVHIVTVNDYLARRDSEWMGKVYRFMGLTVGLIIHEKENPERKEAYAADITYGTNNEMGFDYLRDNMVVYKEHKVQRGHNFAIVDEVDSILIDEARTPLIISGRGEKSTDLYKMANRFALSLKCTRIKEVDSKENVEDLVGDDCDYVVDEKAKTATLTKSGVAKAEKFFNLENLMDPENMTIQHHINQAIKAIGVMKRDVDYVVKDNQVLIVDEFTGRIMLGRRYNEGLHQAIEAKENVDVEHESKTLATITFQNYFRLYKKLSGMTGTAMTESAEFNQIYNLDVIEIPTNKPMIRDDMPDVVYKTEQAKYQAVIKTIEECHAKGQPVLVGTVSIEKSELLSALLKRKGIKHEVLNAKHHEKEAEIVAQAGKENAVTIATNMAGRGTDIKLGGNAEYLAKSELRRKGYSEELIAEATGFAETDNEEILNARAEYSALEKKYDEEIEPEAERVRKAGGLFIIGTERHESRRIDNQLRGRSGRQGDPGASRFFLSLEDDLMRLFGGERITSIMNTLKTPEDMPIEAKMISNTIESAQKKIEGRNFAIRKSVLQYDDVMNRQRELIYKQRNQVLDGEELKPVIMRMIDGSINSAVDFYCSDHVSKSDWNIDGLRDKFKGWLASDDDFRDGFNKEEARETLLERAHKSYEAREELFGNDENGVPLMRELEKMILLRNVDSKWMDHIDAMDQLRRGIGLRAYGQTDPVVAYRNVGSEMFDSMTEDIREDTARQILTVMIKSSEETKREQTAKITGTSGATDGSDKKQPVRKKEKVRPNDPCPCGSGKKYKNCCGDVRKQ
ncbi:MAG: preprotein translocase subunit SecA [Oscillospiraceae bacterium]|nr:preprotein translocase subunit SecA [Clostridiaceae bacterium]MDY5948607.1 preprotein translocase subunit SecA [Oscillospiraceae bacterium]